MNYEELLAARKEGKKNPVRQPIGGFYREQVEGKWRGIVDIDPRKNENIVFAKALKNECAQTCKLATNRQIHFTPVEDANGDVTRLEMELGNFQTFEQMLEDNPAVVARKNFLDDTLANLVEVTEYLHSQGVMHVCFSPKTVFTRKGDGSVLLLSHGSFYLSLSDLHEFYGDDAQFVAPEVLNHGSIDERCDVYSIGKFLLAVFEMADLPVEYRQALKKAVSESPEDRYQTPTDLLKAVQQRRGVVKTVVSLGIAVVIALLCLAVYMDMFPESSPVEFVKPAPRQPTDDLIDDGFDPAELGVTSDGDSLVYAAKDSAAFQASEREYKAKAEAIFRKNYEKEADRILSKIYNKEYMSNVEKNFIAGSESTISELMKKQAQMGEEAGLTPERAELLATEIIERITEQKKKEMETPNTQGNKK